MSCPDLIGVTTPTYLYQVAWSNDQAFLFGSQGSTIYKFAYPSLALDSSFGLSGDGENVWGIDDSDNMYRHSGFDLYKRTPAGVTTRIGRTITSPSGGFSRPCTFSRYTGLAYLLRNHNSTTGPQIRSYDPAGVDSNGTVVTGFPTYLHNPSSQMPIFSLGTKLVGAVYKTSVSVANRYPFVYDLATSTLSILTGLTGHYPRGVFNDGSGDFGVFSDSAGAYQLLDLTAHTMTPMACADPPPSGEQGFFTRDDLTQTVSYEWASDGDYKIWRWPAEAGLDIPTLSVPSLQVPHRTVAQTIRQDGERGQR